MLPHSTTSETLIGEQSGSPAVQKYRELLQAKRDERTEPANAFLTSEPGSYFLKVLPDGTEVYGYAPGAWVPAVFGEWTADTGAAPAAETYWSQVADLTREARRAVG